MSESVDHILKSGHFDCCGGDYCNSTKESEKAELAEAKAAILALVEEAMPKGKVRMPHYDEYMEGKIAGYQECLIDTHEILRELFGPERSK